MGMGKENKYSGKFILFPIGVKLAIIIIVLVLLSLGGVTYFTYYMSGHDAETAAEKSNFDINRRASAEIEHSLSNIRANAQVLVQIINSAGVNSDISKQAKTFYFEENKQIAAVVFQSSNNNVNTLINEDFFFTRGVESSPVFPYYTETKQYFQRAAKGETYLLNAYNSFSMHLLALFSQLPPLPKTEGRAILIIFSPVYLNNSLNYGINETFLVNNSGDILIHPDFELVRNSANISQMDYFSRIRENVMQSRQDLRDINEVKYYIAFTKLKESASVVITRIEYDKIFDEIYTITRRNLYLSAAIVFISILFIRYFSKTISGDLLILCAAAQKLESGDFDLDLEPRARDEIGFLTYNFQRMSAALGAFGVFANREIALKAMRGEIKPGGALKNASISYCGIRGFSERYKNFASEFGRDACDKLVLWLNEYFTSAAACVEKTFGVVDKFIGDTVMAHWGTADTSGTPAKDAFNCVKSALMMRKTLVLLNRERAQNPPMNISCGIASGVVTAGQLGSGNRVEYTVIGEPVTLASEIQALNRRFGTDILISEGTWNLVKFFFTTEEMSSLKVAGIEKPVRIFAVINHVSVTTGPKTLDEVRRMVGIKPPVIKAD
jgi:adenylate cyclase